MQNGQRSTIFISYSHEDRKWLERLQVMLKPLTRSGALVVWDDTRIAPGSLWRDEIENALTKASVAVMLVSPHFLASDFINENELPSLLEAAQRDGLKVLWVAVSASLYKETPLAKFQAVNNPDKPLDRYENRQARLNEELLNIVNQIKAVSKPGASKEDVKGSVDIPKRDPRAGISVPFTPGPSEAGSRGKAVRWSAALTAVAVVFIAWMFWFDPASRLHWMSSSRRNPEPGDHGLVSPAAQRHLDAAIEDLTVFLSSTLVDRNQIRRLHPWLLSQIVVSLGQRGIANETEIADYLHSKMRSDCACWVEKDPVPHIAASSWVILALTRIHSPLDPRAITAFVNMQKTAGWWGINPVSDDPVNAATYATSWAILILDEYRRQNAIGGEQRRGIDSAIQRGREWLVTSNIPARARWRDYPKVEDSIESLSDSALALHVLHRLKPPPHETLDRRWLQELPEQPIAITGFENSGHRLIAMNSRDLTGDLNDSVRRYKLPWILIATTDAYSKGDPKEQALARQLVNRALAEPTDLTRPVSDLRQAHIAAELLIALRYLRGEREFF